MPTDQSLNAFLTKFCLWAERRDYPARVRRLLPDALRRFVDYVGERDDYRDLIHRRLESPAAYPIICDVGTSWIHTNGKELILGAISPSWRGAKVSKNEHIADLIDSFSRLAAQYVYRSRIVKLQASLALTYDHVCDFRDATFSSKTVLAKEALGLRHPCAHLAPTPSRSRSPRSKELRAWIVASNPLDPFVHRALFQYWRSRQLNAADFWEESMVALDGVVAVAGEALQRWLVLSKQPTRSDVGALFGMSRDDIRELEFLYSLRCSFSAHPPHSKWWDFSEIYDEDIGELPDVGKRVLGKLLAMEHRHRTVDPEPELWSVWFRNNAGLIVDAVWPTDLP